LVEIAMPRLTLTGRLPAGREAPALDERADFLDLLQSASQGVFPLPILEAIMARLEGGK
jgi:hypothetical protein